MNQTNKIITVAIIAAILSGGCVYFWQINKLGSPTVSTQEQTKTKSTTTTSSNEGAAKYNCELSSGSFKNGICECPDEFLGDMYDETTGFCQSGEGGPAGDAFAASVGLPWKSYSFWIDIINSNCTKTGGSWGIPARCTCSNGKNYNQSTGYCE